MSKEVLYWLGTGVLEGKDPKTKKKIKFAYGDVILDDHVHPASINKLMKDGVIGTKMTPIKATETARLQNLVKEQDTKIKALEAGDGGKVVELEKTVAELESANAELVTANAGLKKELEDLGAKVAEMEKVAKDAPGGKGSGDKPGNDKFGVGAK